MGTQRISLINEQYLPETEVTRKKKKLCPITRNEKRWWQKSKTSSRHFIHWRRSFHEDAYENKNPLAPDIYSKPWWIGSRGRAAQIEIFHIQWVWTAAKIAIFRVLELYFYDILYLTETKTDNTDAIDIPGFWVFMKNRFEIANMKSEGILWNH